MQKIMIITQITALDKAKVHVSFDEAEPLVLYKSELRRYGLKEQMEINSGIYEELYYEIVGKRAVKRAMHLLERMDRTEEQLRRKLLEGKYPQPLAEKAIDYVKSYHYIDDDRYARNFVRLNQERRSAARMKMDLLSRGIAPDTAERAIEEENEMLPEVLIQRLLEKKHYDPDTAAPAETKKIYQFLLRKGFRSDQILHVLRQQAAEYT